MPDYFLEYLKAIQQKGADATEVDYRTPFENLLNAIKPEDIKFKVTHEPHREKEFGAPDFLITTKGLPIGYIETKKLDEDISQIRKTDQIKKYLKVTPNLIITNYRDFLLIKDGKDVDYASLVGQTYKAVGQTFLSVPPATEQAGMPVLPDIFNKRFRLNPEDVKKLERLFESFFTSKPIEIARVSVLAEELAKRGKLLKEFIEEEIKNDEPQDYSRWLKGLYAEFTKTLIADLDEEGFADAFTQTLIYGLLLAGIDKKEPLNRVSAYANIPRSFAVIHELFDFFSKNDPPERFDWIYDEIIAVINAADFHGIAQELMFTGGHHESDDYDPYYYFYEPFLQKIDAIQKKEKGVYYTPIPVVSFIIRSLDRILKDGFNVQGGFTNQGVTTLDFACGTGTFLAEIFKLVINGLKMSRNEGQIPNTVSGHILKNFYGFEYLVAPYAIAHLKLARLIEEIANGYEFGDKERLQIYLTDTLNDSPHTANPLFQAMSKEGKEANGIKKSKEILVVTGNPPYNVGSKNKSQWLDANMPIYKPEGEKKLNIDDDYIKFIRFAHFKMAQVERGAVGIITNNSFINGITHRKMRAELLKEFDEIYILNLHGNARIGETAPDGGTDQNVFDIMQGVCISFFVKTGRGPVGQTFLSVPYQQEQARSIPVGQTFLSVPSEEKQAKSIPVGQTFLSVPSEEKQAEMPVLPPQPPDGDLKTTRRKLPHWTLPGSYYFVTFSTTGTTLSEKEREIVFSHIMNGADEFYELFALVVMPEHVHLILKPNADRKLSEVMKGIKGVSARLVNKERGVTGKLWLDESYDRIIRDEEEYIEKLNYILQNPIKAGLSESGKYKYLYVEGLNETSVEKVAQTFLSEHEQAEETSVEKVAQTFLSEQNEQAGMPVLPAEKRNGDQGRVFYYDLYGKRDDKFRFLRENDIDSVEWQELDYAAFDDAFNKTRWGKRFPYFKFFVPKEAETTIERYGKAWGMNEIFEVFGSGIKTDRDDTVINYNKKKLTEVLKKAFSGDYDSSFKRKYKIHNSSSYNFADRLEAQEFDENNIKPIQYRPFDFRKIYYKVGFTSRPGYKVMRHFLEGENIGLAFSRQIISDEWKHCFATDTITDGCTVSIKTREWTYVAPLYLYEEPKSPQLDGSGMVVRPNFKREFVEFIEKKYGKKQTRTSVLPKTSAEQTQQPAGQTQQPAGQTQQPAEQTQQPVEQTQQPVEQTQQPVGQTQQPVGQTQQPVGQTFLSVHGTHEQAGKNSVEKVGQTFLSEQKEQARKNSVGQTFLSDQEQARMPVLPTKPTPEQIFGYIYAILYCPTYREKYLELLKIDFPRVPFVDDEALFFELSALGWELVQHHLMKRTYDFISNYPIAGTDEVEKVKMTPTPAEKTRNSVGHTQPSVGQTFLSEQSEQAGKDSVEKVGQTFLSEHEQAGKNSVEKVGQTFLSEQSEQAGKDSVEKVGQTFLSDQEQARMPVLPTSPSPSEKTVRVWINKEQYFDNIPEEVWNFCIGGYQVLDHWLKARKGRRLNNEDITTFHRIVSILDFTIKHMARIEEVAGREV